MTMRVLGVDPSFNRSGWCLLEKTSNGVRLLESGLIVPKGSDRPSQLLSIKQQFEAVLDCGCAASAYFERSGVWQRKGGTRRETIEALSMSRAVMLLLCAEHGLPAHDVEVHVVRHAMFGRVNATPTDVLNLVRREGFTTPLRPRGAADMDIANALVMGIYGLRFDQPG